MDEIVALVLQGSPWAIVALMGIVIRGLFLRLETTHKGYSEAMSEVQEKRREEAVEMSEKLISLTQGLGESMKVLTSAVTGLNGGR